MEVFHMRVDKLSALFDNPRTDKIGGFIKVLKISKEELDALPWHERITLFEKYLVQTTYCDNAYLDRNSDGVATKLFIFPANKMEATL